MAKQWDQQPGETKTAYLAFKGFLELGPTRNATAAYRIAKGKPEAKNAPGTWQKWINAWNWRDRANAFDREQERIEEQARIKAANDEAKIWARRTREHRQEMFETGRLLIQRGREILGYPLTRQKIVGADGKTTIVEPAKFTARDASPLIETGTKLLQLVTGGLTDHVKVEVDEPEDVKARIVEMARAEVARLMQQYSVPTAQAVADGRDDSIPAYIIAERVAENYRAAHGVAIDAGMLIDGDERVN